MDIMVTFNHETLSLTINALNASFDGSPEASSALHRMLDAYSRAMAAEITAPFRKWDALHPVERAQLDATPFGNGNITCSGCGETLPTEGAFARHYLVSDRRYLNLGSCPNKKAPCPQKGATMNPITDDLCEALQGIEETYGSGDGMDGVGVSAYVVTEPIVSYGVTIPVGLYTRDISDDGKHVIGLIWTDADAMRAYVNRTGTGND